MSKVPKKIDDRFLGRSVRNPARQQYEERRLGTFGAASPVRRIDPKTGEIIQPKKEKPPWEE